MRRAIIFAAGLLAPALCGGAGLAQDVANQHVAASPPAASPAELRSRVEALLRAGVETSVPPAAFSSLGDGARTALITIFEAPSAPRYVRLRALSALEAFPSDATERYLRALVLARPDSKGPWAELHPARSSSVLRRAIRALARVSPRPRASDFLPGLAHSDPAVREAAAQALAGVHTPDATRALEAQLQREGSARVRGALLQALTDRSVPRAAPPRGVPESDSIPR